MIKYEKLNVIKTYELPQKYSTYFFNKYDDQMCNGKLVDLNWSEFGLPYIDRVGEEDWTDVDPEEIEFRKLATEDGVPENEDLFLQFVW
jgi:hypothetical protein